MEENRLRFALDKISWTQTFPKTLLASRMQDTSDPAIGKIKIPHRLIAGAIATYKEDGINYGRLRFKGGKNHVDIYDETGKYLNKSDYDFRIKNKKMWLFFNKQAASELQGNISFDFHSWYVEDTTTSWANVSFDSTTEHYWNSNIILNDYWLDNEEFDTDYNQTKLTPYKNDVVDGSVVRVESGNLVLDPVDDLVNSASVKIANISNVYYVKYYSKYTVPSGDVSYVDISIGNGSIVGEIGTNWWHTRLSTSYMNRIQTNTNIDIMNKSYVDVAPDYVIISGEQYYPFEFYYNRTDDTLNVSVNNTLEYTVASADMDYVDTTVLISQGEYSTGLGNTTWIENITVRAHNYSQNPSGNLTNNWTYAISSGEELKTLGCNVTATADGSRTVDIIGSTDNVTWTVEAVNVTGNATVDVSGKGYKYGGCWLKTTDATLTPEVVSLSAEVGAVAVAEAEEYVQAPQFIPIGW
jgi:hypothetical protein